MICDNVHNDMTYTTEMVSPGLGQQHTSCLGEVNCDACHDDTGINLAPVLNLYQIGSYDMKCDEHFIGCDFDINPTSSEQCDADNMSSITACTYTENVGVTEPFDSFRGCQSDINIVHLIPTCTYEFHLYFAMIIQVNFTYSKSGVSLSFSVIRK